MPVVAESVFTLELLEVEGGTVNFTGTELHLLTVIGTSWIQSSHHIAWVSR